MKKEELLELIETKPQWGKNELKTMVTSLTTSFSFPPTHLNLGDVVMHRAIKHPLIVLRKNDDGTFLGAGVSTTDGPHCICELNCRFRKEGKNQYLTKLVTTATLDVEKYMFSIDKREFNRVRKLVSEFQKSTIL